MSHLRKEIRKVLDEMGYSNRFALEVERFTEMGGFQANTVTIQDWEPNPRAIELKKRIERQVNARVVVNFAGPELTN